MGLEVPNPANAAKIVLETGKLDHDPAVAQEHVAAVADTEAEVHRSNVNGVLGVGNETKIVHSDGIDLIVGPLLNYRRMSQEKTDSPLWHGNGAPLTEQFSTTVPGQKLYEEPKGSFWQFPLELPFQSHESQWEYSFQERLVNKANNKLDPTRPRTFWVPAKTESMRMMFHSCNGFSVGTDVEAWSGPALWNDVLRVHEKRPIHVMIGGGDQIYNDGVRVDGPLRRWTDIAVPKKRRDFPFNEKLRAECDEYYYNNYIQWYGTEPFATANAQIAQINIWDDHDIIDGFGSYTDHFMQCPVFRGIGGVAHKYYLLFQHHLPPPKSTYTTDAPATEKVGPTMTAGSDATQLKDAWVRIATSTDPSYIVGHKAGPYVEEVSRSIYCQLGASVGFIGIDARTERTRHQINYPQTYDQIFNRVEQELTAAAGKLKHLIVLLGIPIAYPRLQWLETIFRSPMLGPIRFLNKRFGFAGGFFNSFDGSVDLLDDLDDHYTTHAHKRERKQLILRLQAVAERHSVRVTILGGDVHLAALGRFYSNPSQGLAIENDARYMVNVVSSAITNHPPPVAVANLLARRNKIHHLDERTDETLLMLWDRDPGAHLTAKTNHVTMPSRNYALLTPATRAGREVLVNGHGTGAAFVKSENPRQALHAGEEGCGSTHPAADEGLKPTGLGGEDGLDITFRVEVDHSDATGKTRAYGLVVPGLAVKGGK